MNENTQRPDDDEDEELTSLQTSIGSLDSASIKRLILENPEAAADLVEKHLAGQREANARLLAREQRRTISEYRTKLTEEFPYASPDLIQGTSKKEMRASAERMHKHTEAVLKAAGIEAKPKGAEAGQPGQGDPRPLAERSKDWVQPPAAATEVLSDRPVTDWAELSRKGLAARGPKGDEVKTQVIQNLKDEGPRQIQRESFSMIAGRKAAPAKT